MEPTSDKRELDQIWCWARYEVTAYTHSRHAHPDRLTLAETLHTVRGPFNRSTILSWTGGTPPGARWVCVSVCLCMCGVCVCVKANGLEGGGKRSKGGEGGGEGRFPRYE